MKFTTIAVSKIEDLTNTRTRNKEEDVSDLMQSIKQEGLLQPIGVTPKGDKFELLYGFRRFSAISKLGLKEVPAVILEKKEAKDKLVVNLVENLQREDLSPFEYGATIHELTNKHKMTNKEVATRLGIPASTISTLLDIYHRLPAAYRNKVVNSKKAYSIGKIPLQIAHTIVSAAKSDTISRTQVPQILNLCPTYMPSKVEVQEVIHLVHAGKKPKEAFDSLNHLKTLHVAVAIPAKKLERAIKKVGRNELYEQLKTYLLQAPVLK